MCVCIMLAAGLSSRMGKWKMMLPWGETTVLDSSINHALGFCEQIILVTGFRANELYQRYHSHPSIQLVYNYHYRQGMFSSICCGVEQIKSHQQHFFLALGDMPMIPTNVYAKLWQCRQEHESLIPSYDKGKGHPVLLPFDIVAEIRRTPSDKTMKELMAKFPQRVISVDSESIHRDLDTPDDYLQLNKQYSHQ